MTNTTEQVTDENGKLRDVHFIHIYKFDKETHELYTYRSFIRDYDGAIREMHVKKKYLTEEQKQDIIGVPPQHPHRQEFFRGDHYDLSSDGKSEAEGEGEGDKEEEKKERNSNSEGISGGDSPDSSPFKRSSK